MRSILLLAVTLLTTSLLFGQEMFRDQIFDKVNRLTMTYTDTLKTDIYYVPGRNTGKRSPLVVLVHGGGFYTGTRDGEREVAFAMDLAQRGYVVASIDYHLTRKGKSEGFGCDCPAEEKVETFKEAVLNIDQALDYIVRLSREFHIDANKIVLAGSSAGAESILHAAYAGSHKEFKGIMDGDRKIAAVVSFAGAVLDGVALDRGNAIPAFFVHGTKDELVPYGAAPHHFCGQDAPGYLKLKGSAAMSSALDSLGVAYTLYTAEGGGHEWANKAYELHEEVSDFLYEVLIRHKGGQVNRVIPSKP